MADYSNAGRNDLEATQVFRLKLSVDVREAKNFTAAALVLVQISAKLGDQFHQFRSEQASAIRQGAADSKMSGSFASFEFLADKTQLGQMLASDAVDVSLFQQDGQREVGALKVPLKMLQEGEQKRTVSSVVIVSDRFLEVRQASQVQGLLRVVLYLEDLGVVSADERESAASKNSPKIGSSSEAGGAARAHNGVEEQIVWQLEMWKRAEMAKFLAHLKQKEIE